VLGEVCVGIFSIKDIKENEELSFDYQFDFFKTPFTKCYCGAGSCKGYLGVRPTDENDDKLAAVFCPICKQRNIEEGSVILCRG